MKKITETTFDSVTNSYGHRAVTEAEVPKVCKVYEFLSTPGHGYLKVSHADIRRFGLQLKISTSSYIGVNAVSLEEDCDYGIFLRACLNAGERFFSSERYVKNANMGMRRYHPSFIINPVKVGSRVTLDSTGEEVTITDCRYKRYYFDNHAYAPAQGLLQHIAAPPLTSVAVVLSGQGVLMDEQNDRPIWSEQNANQPHCRVFPEEAEACNTLLKLGVPKETIAQMTFFQVQHDCWKQGEFCPIDVAMLGGVPGWQIDEQKKSSRSEVIRVRNERNSTIFLYNASVDDNEQHKVALHECILPGKRILVPDEIIIACDHFLDAERLNRLTDIIHGKRYVKNTPGKLHRYIEFLTDDLDRIYQQVDVWHSNPLWYVVPAQAKAA